jgi:hypothetical protein
MTIFKKKQKKCFDKKWMFNFRFAYKYPFVLRDATDNSVSWSKSYFKSFSNELKLWPYPPIFFLGTYLGLNSSLNSS